MENMKLTCSNCNAQLELDLENMYAHCPYCGQKLLIGVDQLQGILAEREKTKRIEIREAAQNERIKMKYDSEKRNDHQLLWLFAMMMAVAIIIFILVSSTVRA